MDDVGREDGMKAVGFLMVSEGLIELERLDHHHDHHKWDVFRDHIFLAFVDEQSLLCRWELTITCPRSPIFWANFIATNQFPPLGNSSKSLVREVVPSVCPEFRGLRTCSNLSRIQHKMDPENYIST